MLSKVSSGCVTGIDACPVDVEVDVANGLPSFSVIGLPDVSIRESRARIRSAIKNSGLAFPASKITVNLSPAGPPPLPALGGGGVVVGSDPHSGRVPPWGGGVGQVLGLLVPVSWHTLRCLHFRPIDPLVWAGALPGRCR